MNKELGKMSFILTMMICATSCGIFSVTYAKNRDEENFVPFPAQITPIHNDVVEFPEQNIEEIDTDPTVEGTYDLFTITYYCGCDICNGSWGAFDALGDPLLPGTIACNVLPLGTVVYIDGNRYVVRDRLSSIYDGENRIDIYVEDHQEALDLGIRYNVEVFIENY